MFDNCDAQKCALAAGAVLAAYGVLSCAMGGRSGGCPVKKKDDEKNGEPASGCPTKIAAGYIKRIQAGLLAKFSGEQKKHSIFNFSHTVQLKEKGAKGQEMETRL